MPLNLQWLNNSDNQGLITSALSGNIWHLFNRNDQWQAEKIAGQFESLVFDELTYTDISMATSHAISLNDRFLYVAEWLKGRIRQYDISEIENTNLIADLKIINRNSKNPNQNFIAGPSIIRLNNDGTRLYASSSFVNSWDKQFFANKGTCLIRMNAHPETGELELDDSLYLDFSPGKSGDIFLP